MSFFRPLFLNLSRNGGRKTLTVLLPFAHDWEKGVGDEGNAGFTNMTCSRPLVCSWEQSATGELESGALG